MLITDCIGLKVLSSTSILAGIGNELHHYYLDTNRTTTTITQTLSHRLTDKIHGIAATPDGTNGHHIIIYGGKEYVLVHLANNTLKFVQNCRINDWINSSNLYASGDLALLTSHSIACRMSLSWSDARTDLIDKVSCPDKSTLYSSLIHGTTWSDSVFFSGTALGDLLVWGRTSDGRVEIWHRLSGHNGVIFSIDCSVKDGLITTTSDDRSVKVWQLTLCDNAQWSQCLVKPLRSLFGHTARVFRSKIISKDNLPYILSVGEDANLCVWHANGTLMGRKNLGAALWQLDYDDNNAIAYASGSDGNVKQCSIGAILEGQQYTECILDVPGVNGVSEYLSKIKYLQNGTIVALTNRNRLLYTKNEDRWHFVDDIEPKRKISIIETYENMIAVAGYKCATIYRYNDACDTLEMLIDLEAVSIGMVRSVKFVSSNTVVTCDDQGNCSLCHLHGSTVIYCRFQLPKSKERWITAALQWNAQVLLLGDRSGNLHVFNRNADDQTVELRQTLKQLHGILGCTTMCRLPCGDIITAGHDGTVKTLCFDVTTTMQLTVRLTAKVPVLWIDKIILLHSIVAGFNDNRFVVWHRQRRELLAEIECGGGHRYWDMHVKENACHFIYIRNKRLHRIAFALQQYAEHKLTLPVNQWHSKSCTVVCAVPSSYGTLLVSGGDDNVLKVSRLHGDQLRYIDNMTVHISSVKCISCTAHHGPNRWLVLSAGGRAQICVTEVKVEDDGAVVLTERTNFMLRLSDVERRRQGTANVIDFDPETRFMSLTMMDATNVVVGCSDGFVRHLRYENDRFCFVQAVYYGKCIMHVHRLNDDILLTMATDGCVCFWDWRRFSGEAVNEPFHVLRHHESGIQTFDVLQDGDREQLWFIVTGGDDQAVVISHFGLNEQQVIVRLTHRLEHLHTAQVNGVRFAMADRCLYTTGVDQTVFRIRLPTLECERVATTCVADTKGILVLDDGEEMSTVLIVYGYGVQLLRS